MAEFDTFLCWENPTKNNVTDTTSSKNISKTDFLSEIEYHSSSDKISLENIKPKNNDDDVKCAFSERTSDDVNPTLSEKSYRKRPDEDKECSKDKMNVHPVKVCGSSTRRPSTSEQIFNPDFNLILK